MPAHLEKLLQGLVAEGRDLDLIEADDTSIDELIDAGRLVEAAERATEKVGEPVFRRVVQRELDEEGLPIPPATEALISIDWPLIVTTNLDRMLASAYVDRHARPMRRLNGMDTGELIAAVGGTLKSRETILAQIHGDVDTYRSWCVTESHYRRLIAMPGYLNALESLFIRRVFFVGFGLEDMDFDLVLQAIAEIYPAGGGEAYALIPRPRGDRVSASIRKLLKLNGLRPIFYEVESPASPDDPFGGHRAAYECLDHLASTWRAAKIGIEVDLEYFPALDPDIVGRDREVARLVELLVEEGGQIVQLVGLGGLGKTSLIQRFVSGNGARSPAPDTSASSAARSIEPTSLSSSTTWSLPPSARRSAPCPTRLTLSALTLASTARCSYLTGPRRSLTSSADCATPTYSRSSTV